MRSGNFMHGYNKAHISRWQLLTSSNDDVIVIIYHALGNYFCPGEINCDKHVFEPLAKRFIVLITF